MSLKKLLVSLLAVCFTASAAHATMCTDSGGADGAIGRAQTALNIAKAMNANGVASNYDVLMAEKSLLELKICVNYNNFDNPDPNDVNGYSSIKALASNTVARLAIAKAIFQGGSGSQVEVDMVSGEKDMRARVCVDDILKNAKARAANGTISNFDVQKVQDACDILNK